MDQIAHCKTCGAKEESIFHAFFECTWARQFWQELKKATSIKLPVLHPMSWTIDLTDGRLASEETASVILCGCWAVWTERNAVWHGDKGRSVTESVKWTLDTTIDLTRTGKSKISKPVRGNARWRKPDPGIYKINVDASFRGDDMQGGTGLIVRDHNGVMIRAQALWYKEAASARIMEAKAIRDATKFAVERGYQNVHIEYDAQEVVSLWNDPGDGRFCIGRGGLSLNTESIMSWISNQKVEEAA